VKKGVDVGKNKKFRDSLTKEFNFSYKDLDSSSLPHEKHSRHQVDDQVKEETCKMHGK